MSATKNAKTSEQTQIAQSQTDKTVSKKARSSKKAQLTEKSLKKPSEFKSISQAVYYLLSQFGESVSYDLCEKYAKEIKADSKFNKYHLSYFKHHFKNKTNRFANHETSVK